MALWGGQATLFSIRDENCEVRHGVTRCEIDLGVVAANYCKITSAVAPSRVMAIIKDNAYGHGLVPVALRLRGEGCCDFGVATLVEALALEKAGVPAGHILILRTVAPAELPISLGHGFSVTVGDARALREIDRAAASLSVAASVQLKVDTGLGRLGFLPDQTAEVVTVVQELKATKIQGIYSHFAMTALRHPNNDTQLRRFLDVCEEVGRAVPGITRHIAAAAGMFGMPESRLDMVRPGGPLFGLTGVGANPWGLEPALCFKAPIAQVKTVPSGWNVGYGLVYSAKEGQRIGTVAAGAGDGYPYALKLKADVLVWGKRCRVLGMALDAIMIDLSGVPEAVAGDEAVLVGTSGDESIGVEELGRVAGTSYGEILSRISARVPRVYKDGGRVVAVESQVDVVDLLLCNKGRI